MNKSSTKKKGGRKNVRIFNKVKKITSMYKKTNRIRGRGGYFQDAINWGKRAISNLNENERPEASNFNKVANKIGSTIGNEFGIGKQLGNAASWLSRVIGMGNYNVKNNSLMSAWGRNCVEGGNTTACPPTFGSASKGSDIIFSHSEFVADMKSAVDFTTTKYALNPGNPVLFPWLSQIASLYEEYEFMGLLFQYKSTSGTSNTAAVPGMGQIIIATDYDTYDSNFTGKRQMEASEFCSTSVPYDTFLHPVECDPSRNVLKRLYVQPGVTTVESVSGDRRFSFLGQTTVATLGQQATGITMGELWVTYHVRLSRPILESSSTVAFTQYLKGSCDSRGNNVQFQFNTTAGGTGFGVAHNESSNLITFNNNDNNYQGYYMVNLICRNPATTPGAGWDYPSLTGIISYGVDILNFYTPNSESTYSSTLAEGGGTSIFNEAQISMVINIRLPNAYWEIPYWTNSDGGNNLDIIITPFNRSVTDNPTPALQYVGVKNGNKIEMKEKLSLEQIKTISLSKDEVKEIPEFVPISKLIKNRLGKPMIETKNRPVKTVTEEELDADYDVVGVMIDVLKKESSESYTLSQTVDRLKNIIDMLEEATAPQIVWLVEKQRQLERRRDYLQSLA